MQKDVQQQTRTANWLMRAWSEGRGVKLYAAFGLCVALCICLMSGTLSAQVKSSSIVGTVTDTNGDVVTGAKVVVTEEATNVSTEAATSSKGEFSVPYLPIGSFTLEVSAPGFETYRKTGIMLASATAVRNNVKLTVGSTTASVTVEANAAALQTESATVQGSVDTKLIANLPNINNNPLYWATLNAGVVPTMNVFNSKALGVGYQDRQQMSQFRMGGNELGSNDIQLNGSSIQGSGWHETAVLPNPDSLQEVNVVTNNFAADTGMAGGVVSMITKAGTNQFHGNLNYMARNEALTANGFANNWNSIKRGKYRVNQYGGSVGGPVILPKLFNGKDKLFFFVSYMRLSHTDPVGTLMNVPTGPDPATGSQGTRNGDFSQTKIWNAAKTGKEAPKVYDYTTAKPYQNSTTIFQRDFFVSGLDQTSDPTKYDPQMSIIPSTRLDAVPFGRRIYNAYPMPDADYNIQNPRYDDFNNNNYSFTGTTPESRWSLNTRMDYKLGQKQSIFATGGISSGAFAPPDIWSKPGFTSDFINLGQGGWQKQITDSNPFITVGDTINLGPTMFVDVRYGITRIETMAGVPNTPGKGDFYGVPSGLQGIGTQVNGTPIVYAADWGFDGNDILGGNSVLSGNSWAGKVEHQTNHSLNASITKVMGNWTFKEGGEYRVYLQNWQDVWIPTPSISGGTPWEGSWSAKGSDNWGYDNSTTVGSADPADSGVNMASMLMGTSGWRFGGGSATRMALASKYVALYSQNNWRPTSKLMLSLGLRYEIQPAPTERFNRMSSVDLSVHNPLTPAQPDNALAGMGVRVFPGVNGYGRGLYVNEYTDFAPRLGATYQFNENTVIRGGFGRSYLPSNTGFNANSSVYGTSSFGVSTQSRPWGLNPHGMPMSTFDQNPTAGNEGNTQITPQVGANPDSPAVYGNTNQGTAYFDYRGYKNGVTDQWNVFVERNLGREWLVSAGYVGSRSHNLMWSNYSLQGDYQIRPSILLDWFNRRVASSGLNDPLSTNVSNPYPGLSGAVKDQDGNPITAGGDIGSPVVSPKVQYYAYLPFYGQTLNRSLASSNYNALVLTAKHDFKHGVLFMANYVWSKTMGITGGYNQNGYAEGEFYGGTAGVITGGLSPDMGNPRNNYALLGWDTPNRFSAALTWDLPVGKGRMFDPHNTIARAIVGGWQASTAVNLQGGSPFGVSCGGYTLNHRCNVAPGQPVKLPKSLQKWYDGQTARTLPDGHEITPGKNVLMRYNPDRFQVPEVVQMPNGLYTVNNTLSGTTSMTEGDLRTFGMALTNISLVRKFDIMEWGKFEIHADATNVFNHTNIMSGANNGLQVQSIATANKPIGVNSNESWGSFGMTFMEPRQLTLSGKLTF